MKSFIQFLLLIWMIPAFTQQNGDLLELQSEQSTADETDFQQLLEDRDSYRRSPLNLNKATVEQISSLLILDAVKAFALIEYRTANGNFLDWQELERVPGINHELVEQLKPFCSISSGTNYGTFFKEMVQKSSFEQTVKWSQALEKSKGYKASAVKFPAYPGNPSKLYTRTRFSVAGQFSAALITEKDPGEISSFPPDFVTGHIYLANQSGWLRKLVIGDFSFSSGLGLMFNGSLPLVKSAQISQLYRPPGGIKPYTSADESRFLRGSGVTIALKSLEITLLGSAKRTDGSIENGEITSSYSNGLHRTGSEQKRKNRLLDRTAGFDLKWTAGRFKSGLNYLASSLSMPIYTQTTQLFGFNELIRTKNGLIFFESISTGKGEAAWVSGILHSINSKLSFTVVARSYPYAFDNRFGAGIANSGANKNERGLLIGLEHSLSARQSISAYIDQYRYPGPSFYTRFPASQRDLLFQWTYTIKRKLTITNRFRHQLKQKDSELERRTIQIENPRYSYRLHAEYSLRKTWVFKNRIELNGSDLAKPGGILIYADVAYKPIDSYLSFSNRISLSKILGYEDRIYSFENDVPYSYSISALNTSGWRYYALINLQRGSWEIWLRYSVSIAKGAESLGSGNDEITGNKKSQLSIELRFRIR